MLKKFGIAALAASVLVAGVAGIVFAQDVAPPPDYPCDEPRHEGPLAEILGMSMEELHETIADGKTIIELAEAKGMSMEDVALAFDDHYADHIQQAVADGKITQEQADQWLENMQGRLEYRLKNSFSDGFRDWGHGRFEGHDVRFGSLAEILGINIDEIEEALADGKTPIELAEELGIDIESLMLERIQQLVSEGKITQEQADLRIKRIQEREDFVFGWGGEFHPHRMFNSWD